MTHRIARKWVLLLAAMGLASGAWAAQRSSPAEASSHAPGASAATSIRALPELDDLERRAPQANSRMLALALDAVRCAQASGVGREAQRLAVIDYSVASTQPRLWVFDLASSKLLFHDLVAHGKGSGANLATRFSNGSGSKASSLGLFITGNTYSGKNGYSLRLDGLEPGFNDAARSRAIVFHGAPYVSFEFARRVGRLGRSWGCPALREAVTRPIIDALRDGQFVFAYYPDEAWLTQSTLLHCPAARSGGRIHQ